jgi:hypothetical protein
MDGRIPWGLISTHVSNKWKNLNSAGSCVNDGNEDFIEIIVVIKTLSPFLI